MTQLQVQLSIPIPSDTVLITKLEYTNLKQQELLGQYWTMKDLEKRTNKKSEWIKENILYPSRFKKILDVKNNGFVFYPNSKGQNWSFNATKMALFLEKYFADIFK